MEFGVNQRRYSRGSSVFRQSMHAEMDLIRKLGNRAAGAKIYLYRFNNADGPESRCNKNGRPCMLCQHALKAAGVSRVVYVNDDGVVSTLKARDMVHLVGHPTEITRHFLDRYSGNHHGRFVAQDFLAG